MSLLMDALKKAEEAKRLAAGKQPPEADAAASPTLELLPVSPSPESASPDFVSPPDSVDAELSSYAQPSRLRQTASANRAGSLDEKRQEAAERATARNVFSAKQAPPSRAVLGVLLGLAGLIALGIVGYFWWQFQSINSGSTAQTRPYQTPAAAIPPASSNQPSVASARPADPIKPLVEPQRAQTSATQAPGLFEPAPRQTKPSAAGPESPVRLSKSQPKTNAALDQAYAALQAGRFDDAHRGYEQVLHADAKNIDALLGIATLAARQGQNERAQAYYLLALEVDPKDPTAQAGLINTRGRASPTQSESQLKTALAGQPDSPALNFALGNLYAGLNRWSEAQQAYFNAYSAEPENPDFIFNLAVSLDHLHQNKLAVQYYQMALKAANNSRSISFDRDQVRNRLLELQP